MLLEQNIPFGRDLWCKYDNIKCLSLLIKFIKIKIIIEVWKVLIYWKDGGLLLQQGGKWGILKMIGISSVIITSISLFIFIIVFVIIILGLY